MACPDRREPPELTGTQEPLNKVPPSSILPRGGGGYFLLILGFLASQSSPCGGGGRTGAASLGEPQQLPHRVATGAGRVDGDAEVTKDAAGHALRDP